jgi:hypothetical protein
MDWRHVEELLAAGYDVYSELKNLCVWVKDNGGMGSLYRSQHELVLVFKHGCDGHRNNVQLGQFGRNRSNVWHYHAAAARGRCRWPCAHPGAMDVVRFPAIAEEDEVHEIETILGPRIFSRRRDEALHPQREPLDTLERIPRTIGEYNFTGQYQQSPAPLGGGLVKAGWFKYYTEKDRPESFDRIV